MARRINPKRRRDPNAPVKPKAAWRMFFSENRDEIKNQYPDLNSREIQKKLSELWRHCDDTIKLRYRKQYQLELFEYEDKLTAYKQEKKKTSQPSDSNKHSSQSKQVTILNYTIDDINEEIEPM